VDDAGGGAECKSEARAFHEGTTLHVFLLLELL